MAKALQSLPSFLRDFTHADHSTALEILEQTLQDVQNGKVMGMFLIPPIKPPPTCTNAHTHSRLNKTVLKEVFI